MRFNLRLPYKGCQVLWVPAKCVFGGKDSRSAQNVSEFFSLSYVIFFLPAFFLSVVFSRFPSPPLPVCAYPLLVKYESSDSLTKS